MDGWMTRQNEGILRARIIVSKTMMIEKSTYCGNGGKISRYTSYPDAFNIQSITHGENAVLPKKKKKPTQLTYIEETTTF